MNDIDKLENSEMVVAIENINNIRYEYYSVSEMISNYFKIIEENNGELLNLINKQTIDKSRYFPVFAFFKLNNRIEKKKS